MENKKLKAVILILIAAVLFGIVFMVFTNKSLFNKVVNNPFANQKVPENLPQLVCDYPDDQTGYQDAINTGKLEQCDCIKDDQLKNICKDATMNARFYSQALTQMDASVCGKISIDNQKEACEKVVLDSIEQLKKEDPQYLANIYLSAHNEEAISALESLVVSGNNDVDTYTRLALAYAEKGLREQERGNDQMPYVQKALDLVEKAKAIDQNNSEVYRVEAYANEIKPDYGMAIVFYDKAIELDQKNVLAYAGRGHVNRMLGALDQSVNDFTKAAELDTEKININIYTNLCNLEYSRGHNEDAIKNCEIVTKSKDADPAFQSEAYQTMALILMNARKYEQARSYLLTAKTLTPNDANLYTTFSKLNIFEQRYTDSEENARKAMEISPTKANAHLMLSYALYMQEKYQDAIQAAEKGISLVQGDVSLLSPGKPATERDLNYSIANCYRQMGNASQQKEYEKRAQDAFNKSTN